MADISKIDVGGTTYDIKDVAAREAAANAQAAATTPNGMKELGRATIPFEVWEAHSAVSGATLDTIVLGEKDSYYSDETILSSHGNTLLNFRGDVPKPYTNTLRNHIATLLGCRLVVIRVYGSSDAWSGVEASEICVHTEYALGEVFAGVAESYPSEPVADTKDKDGTYLVYKENFFPPSAGYGPFETWLHLSDALRDAIFSLYQLYMSDYLQYMRLEIIGYN